MSVKLIRKYAGVCLFASLFSLAIGSLARAEGDLAVHYVFNEGSGSVSYDDSTNKNNGKICGAEYVKSAKGYAVEGYALKFDGADDYIDGGNNASLNIGTNDFSIEFWCDIDALPDGYWGLISKKSGDWGAAHRGYEIIVNLSAWMYIGDGNTSPGYIARTSTVLENTGWHHIVFTLDRDGNGKSYVDGDLEGTTAISSAQGSLDNTLNLNIMRRSGSGYYVKGMIDEVRIYRRALSEKEIRENFKKKIAAKICSWKQVLTENERKLNAMPALAEEEKRKAQAALSALGAEIDKTERRGIIYPFAQDEIDESVRQLEGIISDTKNKNP